jgi:transposase
MRGAQDSQQPLFSYVSQEDRIPEGHPLRQIRSLIDPILVSMSAEFAELYSTTGRPSIPPEQLLRALVLQTLYTIRSERLLIEELNYNLLFRWFVGLTMDDPVWNASTFSKNRERLLSGDIAAHFMSHVVALAREHRLLSDEHFTVDGTLVEAWASHKSFQKKESGTPAKKDKDDPSNPTVDFHGEKRTNDTHQSTTDPEARLMRKGPGKESRLSFMGHVLMDNRHGLAVDTSYSLATGRAEREAAASFARTLRERTDTRVTIGADKNYDTQEMVETLRALAVTPHVAQNNTCRSSAIDERTTRHAGYQISQQKRKLVEEIFGWLKTIGLLRKTRFKGLERGGWMFTFATAVYDLLRIKNLVEAGVCPC